jgi:hypothetical protein
MNIVTIDPSLVSTAVTINNRPFSIVSANLALNKKNEYTKWFKLSEPHCDIITIDTNYKDESVYSKLEINKLETFQKTANIILELLDNHCDDAYSTLVVIEGYSYSSAAGPLIDLVTFGTLVRSVVSKREYTEVVILSPSTVKKLSAQLTYPPTQKGKKIEYRNNQGIAGGSFKKHDMLNVLLENKEIESKWIDFLRDHQEELLAAKSIPKPIEDINDSMIMYHIVVKISWEYEEEDNEEDFISKLLSY